MIFFCSATALGAVRPGSIHWTISGADAMTDADHDNGDLTISPTSAAPDQRKRARFKTNGHGPIVVSATYELADGNVPEAVSQPPTTANALMSRLHTVAGFDVPAPDSTDPVTFDTPGAVTYDPANKALDFHLVRHFSVPAGSLPNGTIDIGNKLLATTGIKGLGAITPSGANAATLTVALSDVVLDLHFGVLLVDSVTDIDPAATYGEPSYAASPRGVQDRFYVGAPTGGRFLSIDRASVAELGEVLDGKRRIDEREGSVSRPARRRGHRPTSASSAPSRWPPCRRRTAGQPRAGRGSRPRGSARCTR